MAGLDGEFGTGPARVNIRGLNRAVRQLQQAGADTADMKDLMHEVGMVVVRQAQSDVPVNTGTLRGTIRAGRGKTKAVVRAGTSRKPYAPIVHYGNPQTGSRANPFLVNALRQRRTEVMDTFERGLERILKKNNLI